MARHLAPFSCRQRMAEIVRRRSFGAVLPLGRHAAIRGSRLIHCASTSIAPPHLILLSSHSRGAPSWMKRLWWCGRQGDWFCLGVSEPVTEFDRRPFEHPLLSPGTVAGQLRSASVLEHVR